MTANLNACLLMATRIDYSSNVSSFELLCALVYLCVKDRSLYISVSTPPSRVELSDLRGTYAGKRGRGTVVLFLDDCNIDVMFNEVLLELLLFALYTVYV